jgi:uncharacterized protein (TIGR04255 family)
MVPRVSAVAYSFQTEDRAVTLSLSPESISLSTGTYTQWESFRSCLQGPLRALNEIYRPSFFSRIGLRYVDAIERGRVGLSGAKWSQLLRPEILAELQLPQFEDNLRDLQRMIRVSFPEGGGSMLLRHGLGQVQGHDETCYMIDFDFYTDRKTEVQDAERVLDGFNGRAGHAFRWCITGILHQSLGPTEIAPDRGPRASV